MPEGDILRRCATRLSLALGGQRLTIAELRWPSLASSDLTGATPELIHAYGKHLLMDFDDGSTLHTHLKMDGQWNISQRRELGSRPTRKASAFTRAILGNDKWVAFGHQLGLMERVRTRDVGKILGYLGPDILAEDFDIDAAAMTLLESGDSPIGPSLLDQRKICGIGTIFMAESLFLERTHPLRPSQSSPVTDILHTARRIMLRSVKARTPTATGDTRHGQTTLVHGRQNLPCRRCGQPIHRIMVGKPPQERPAFFCPHCQA